jgi:hypothetical protein
MVVASGCVLAEILQAECMGEGSYSFYEEDFSVEGVILWRECCAELALLRQSKDDS